MKLAALFPGQGAQSVGMGSALAQASDQARELFDSADKALGYSLTKLCFEGPIEELTLTQNAQPALLTVAVALYREADIRVAAGAGHSLGEYSALVAAGALAFDDAVQLVHKRGRYMQEAVQPGAGKMVAVMGPSEADLAAAIQKVSDGVAEIANLNSPGQTVVAGDNAGVDAFSALMKEAGAKVIPLNVSAPFHCSLMKPASDKLAADLDNTSFSDPAFPIYANVSAEPVTNAADARMHLKEQVCGSVRWTESMQNMVSGEGITHVVEFGPGGVLSKLMKRIDKSIGRIEVSDSDSAAKAKNELV